MKIVANLVVIVVLPFLAIGCGIIGFVVGLLECIKNAPSSIYDAIIKED